MENETIMLLLAAIGVSVVGIAINPFAGCLGLIGGVLISKLFIDWW